MRKIFTILFVVFTTMAYSQNTIIVEVFDDFNGNGIIDSGEGFSSVPIEIYNFGESGGGFAPVATGSTMANGIHTFAGNVPGGTYDVVIPQSWLDSNPEFVQTVGNNPRTITVPSFGETTQTASFGYRCYGMASGIVFDDINFNGVQDSGEPGLANASVMIEVNSPSSPTNPATIVTGANGMWNYPVPIPKGSTEVTVSVAAVGYNATTPNPETQTVFCGTNTQFAHGFSTLLLPVELISFDAIQSGQDVELSWSTATELNNDYFEVQFSLDGLFFEKIGTIQGNGTTKSISNYEFIHENANDFSGSPMFYRLKQVDFIGELFEYSNVEIISFDDSSSTNKIFPNPVYQGGQIGIQSEKDIKSITVIDARGQVVEQRNTKGGKYESINSSNLPSGVYFIVINGNGKAQKVVVQ